MTTVNMFEAKSNLSRLVAAVEKGTEREILIARNGKPVAKLIPLSAASGGGKRLGLLAGKFPVLSQEDFDEGAAQIADMFGRDAP